MWIVPSKKVSGEGAVRGQSQDLLPELACSGSEEATTSLSRSRSKLRPDTCSSGGNQRLVLRDEPVDDRAA